MGVWTHHQRIRTRSPFLYHEGHNHPIQFIARISKSIYQSVEFSLITCRRSHHAYRHSSQLIARPSRSDLIRLGILHLRHNFRPRYLYFGYPIATDLLPQDPPPYVLLSSAKRKVPSEDYGIRLRNGEALKVYFLLLHLGLQHSEISQRGFQQQSKCSQQECNDHEAGSRAYHQWLAHDCS